MIALRIQGEVGGHVVSCGIEVLVAVSPKPFPPGKPLELALLLPDAEMPLHCRVIGSKKRDDGRFELRVRLTNLRRETREQLQALFP